MEYEYNKTILDDLPGFELSMIEITDPGVIATSGDAFHPISTLMARPPLTSKQKC